MAPAAHSHVPAALERPQAGLTLPQEYYVSDEVFHRDMRMYGSTQWLLVDHSSRIANAGDWFTYEFGGESIIVIRNKDDQINAFYNVCRHRGSIICALNSSGTTKLLTCGYHAWTYDLDGNLRPPRYMPEDFDNAEYSLRDCHVRVHDGLIFINLSPGPPPEFEAMIADLRPFLEPHDLANAKIAISKSWVVDANWKLNVENFFECYHCRPVHPTYTGVHDAMKLSAFGAGAGSSGGAIAEKYQEKLKQWNEQASAKGLYSGIVADDTESDFFRAASRLPIKDGCLTETLDGQPASTLMGRFREFDGGQTGMSFNATCTILANNDFAIMFRYTPLRATKTELMVAWLVDKNAVEGVDYTTDNLAAVWGVTLDEDKMITENNQLGVLSSAYQPGVYSVQEQRIADFTQWYVNRLERFEACSNAATPS